MKTEVILMTRWHGVFRCKNRLSSDLNAHKAAIIQEQLTNHSICVAKALEGRGLADIKLAVSGLGPKAAKRWAKLKGIQAFAIQGQGSLGLRMRRQLLKAQNKIFSQTKERKNTIIIGTDLPTLSERDLIKAIHELNTHEIVLGPANDGGYWLIGFSKELLKPIPYWPFSGISWGTSEVLQETIKLAKERGIRYKLLRTQNDLDNANDLLPWLIKNKL